MRKRRRVYGPTTMQRIYDSTKITPDEIIWLVKELSQRRGEGEKADRVAASFMLFQKYDRDTDEETDKAFVILQRMDCLVKLVGQNDPRMRGWTLEGIENGCVLTNEAVFRATARCRIRRKDNHAYFKPDEFFDLVLSESQPEGSVA